MAKSFTIEEVLVHTTLDFGRLEPAPCVRKCDEIFKAVSECTVQVKDPEVGATYPILENYREYVLYLPGQWRLVRTYPNHEGINQWGHEPVAGERERGVMRRGEDSYEVIVKYN